MYWGRVFSGLFVDDTFPTIAHWTNTYLPLHTHLKKKSPAGGRAYNQNSNSRHAKRVQKGEDLNWETCAEDPYTVFANIHLTWVRLLVYTGFVIATSNLETGRPLNHYPPTTHTRVVLRESFPHNFFLLSFHAGVQQSKLDCGVFSKLDTPVVAWNLLCSASQQQVGSLWRVARSWHGTLVSAGDRKCMSHAPSRHATST